MGSRQQPDDEEDECTASPPPTPASGAADSPGRDRRGQFSLDQHHAQLKSSTASESVGVESPYKRLHLEVQKLKEALQVMRAEKDGELFLEAAARAVAEHRALRRRERGRGPQEQQLAAACSLDAFDHRARRHPNSSARSTREPEVSRGSRRAAEAAGDLVHFGGAYRRGVREPGAVAAVLALDPVWRRPCGVERAGQRAAGDRVSVSLAHQPRVRIRRSPRQSRRPELLLLPPLAIRLWAHGRLVSLPGRLRRSQPIVARVLAYLFAQKLLHPRKVFLLRGNHETRAVNGLEAYYGSGCFLTQCRQRFGREEGYIVWHQINHAFDRLPLAATIDDAVFCVHGGIPRSLPSAGETRLESIRRLPVLAPMDVLDKRFYDANPQLSMVSDMLWGRPGQGGARGGARSSHGLREKRSARRQHRVLRVEGDRRLLGDPSLDAHPARARGHRRWRGCLEECTGADDLFDLERPRARGRRDVRVRAR